MSAVTAPRILVVDDDRLFLEIIQFHLERSNYRVDVASDPREGLNRAIEYDYQLVVLDLMMPGLNGEEVMSLLKPFQLKHRILVVSAHAGDEYRARARDLGASAYVTKPIEPDALCRVVDDLVRHQTAPEPYTAQEIETPSRMNSVVQWVFDEGEITRSRQAVALAVLAGLVGLCCWLLFF